MPKFDLKSAKANKKLYATTGAREKIRLDRLETQ
jgi:hypothetical protein